MGSDSIEAANFEAPELLRASKRAGAWAVDREMVRKRKVRTRWSCIVLYALGRRAKME